MDRPPGGGVLAVPPSEQALSLARIREDFSILSTTMHGKPLVYLDNGATSQKPRVVVEAMREYLEEYCANIHRGAYHLSEKATERYERTREKLRKLINARSVAEIIYVRGTTEAVNLVSHSWGLKFLKPGDEVLITEMEHHSNIVPWQIVTQRTGATLRWVPLRDDGTLDLAQLDALINPRTRLVAVTQCSNVLGTINPIQEITLRAHRHGAVVLVDGAQSVPNMPVDVQLLGCDFLAFSGHKMCGPTGIGVLYGRRELLEKMDPWLGGGDMIREVRMEASTWNDLPWKFEGGTPAIAEVIGLGAAVDYLQSIGLERIRNHEQALAEYALERLRALGPDVRIFGPRLACHRGGVVAFTFADIHPHDLATLVDHEGVCIRAGHHCAQPIMRRFGVAATARASFYLYNTEEEVDHLLDALRKAREFFSDASR